MQARNERRLVMKPVLDTLEGRALMAAGAGGVRVREMLAGSTDVLFITGTAKSDVVTIDDNGTAANGNVKVTLGNGRVFVSRGPVSVIQVKGGSGADKVTYNLNGDQLGLRTLRISLDAGNDTFQADLKGAVRTTSALDMQVYGGSGNDNLSVNQGGAMFAGTIFPFLDGGVGDDTLAYQGTGDVGKDANAGPVLMGGDGNDRVTLDYTGQVLGTLLYNVSLDGGAGNDLVDAALKILDGSTGKIGSSSSLPALVQGGTGNDDVRFRVAVDTTASTAQINAKALGNDGNDTVQRSKVVFGDSTNESDALIA